MGREARAAPRQLGRMLRLDAKLAGTGAAASPPDATFFILSPSRHKPKVCDAPKENETAP
jgi:hypothetical protein